MDKKIVERLKALPPDRLRAIMKVANSVVQNRKRVRALLSKDKETRK